jgi:hypothetical protein
VHSKALQLSHAFFCSGNIRCTKWNREIRVLILSIETKRARKGKQRTILDLQEIDLFCLIISHTLKAQSQKQ